jgi:hypothetical protein
LKAIVVAESFHQFATYVRNRHGNRQDYGYFTFNSPEDTYGLKPNTPVHWLEGWSENPTVTQEGIDYLKHKFTTHKEISERRIYNEGISF